MTPRADAIRTARDWWDRKPVFIDTETTGLKGAHEVCELAVIEHEGAVLTDSLIRPTIPITREAADVHGITNAMVNPAPSFKDIWPSLQAALAGRLVVIYNLDFDLPRLVQSARANGLDATWLTQAPQHGESPWRCAMKLYAQFHGEWNRYHGNYRWHRLGDAARHCGITLPPDLHRARADAELTRRIVSYMAQQAK